MLDVKASGYVFNPINDDLMIIRSFPENVKSVLWDNSVTDKEIFVVLDKIAPSAASIVFNRFECLKIASNPFRLSVSN